MTDAQPAEKKLLPRTSQEAKIINSIHVLIDESVGVHKPSTSVHRKRVCGLSWLAINKY